MCTYIGRWSISTVCTCELDIDVGPTSIKQTLCRKGSTTKGTSALAERCRICETLSSAVVRCTERTCESVVRSDQLCDLTDHECQSLLGKHYVEKNLRRRVPVPLQGGVQYAKRSAALWSGVPSGPVNQSCDLTNCVI